MLKFYLFCSAGMSTSLLAKKMQECATAHNLNIVVRAYSINVMDDTIQQDDPDCILLGPQVNYILEKTKLNNPSKPVMVISMSDYGSMNGEAVLKSAIVAYKAFAGKEK